MRDLQECLPYVEHLRAEHRRLNQRLCHITCMFPDTTSATKAIDLPPITKALQDLRRELAHHFSEEESEGCIEEVLGRCPSLSRNAQAIVAEHPILLSKLDRLIQDSQLTEFQASALESRFRQFDALLRKHEAAENRILQLGFGASVEQGE